VAGAPSGQRGELAAEGGDGRVAAVVAEFGDLGRGGVEVFAGRGEVAGGQGPRICLELGRGRGLGTPVGLAAMWPSSRARKLRARLDPSTEVRPMTTTRTQLTEVLERRYAAGFVTDIDADQAPPGLSEDIIGFISAKKDEPTWLLEWRLKAYRHWLTMTEPTWAKVRYPAIDYQAICYYSAPKLDNRPASLDEVAPEILRTYEKLGIPLAEQELLAGVAVDAVFDSVSVATTFRERLAREGIIFCSISDAVREHPELVRAYLGSVVPYTDNFFATLNSAVFTDGSFVYLPPGVRCPMELSTYFRINAARTGQFERTLIIADPDSYVSYLEGCTAPMRDENQLHAAVVELVAHERAEIKYATVQNWYPGDERGVGGIYNFVTKRGLCEGRASKISWTQVETGSAITWKYPGCVLKGDDSVGAFHSIALSNHYQQADTGTKMIHLGKNTRSTIISKGISAGHGQQTYRGLVRVGAKAAGARNYTQCDSLLIGDQCGAHTVPYMEVKNASARVEHEATTTRIGADQLFYCRQRGLSQEDAVSLIVNGFCKEVIGELPMEFAVEAQKLLGVSLEGAVG
jgi:Fe-S cluster assembly protein SufB